MKHVLLSLALALVTTIGNATCLYVHNASANKAEVTWEIYKVYPWKPWIPPLVEYSTDGGVNWIKVTYGTSISVDVGKNIYFRGDNASYFNTDVNHVHLSCNQDFTLGGDMTSLLNGMGNVIDISGYEPYLFYSLLLPADIYSHEPSKLVGFENDFSLPSTTLSASCYDNLFARCTLLKKAPVLPATTLAESCYKSMFADCKALTNAPSLPARTLAKFCYNYMFHSCTSLVAPPELSVMALADGCYYGMFYGCESLKDVPKLPATTLSDYCYTTMFCGCTSLTNAPPLPATTLRHCCYWNMFGGCTSLKEAPALPATELAESCYMNMFSGCSLLMKAPALPATELTDFCYETMFSRSGLKDAPVLPATKLTTGCYQSMFSSCSALTNAPVLPATTLTANCYNQMFQYCYNLKSVTVGFTAWNEVDTATFNWLEGCVHGVFTCPAELDTSGISRGESTVPPGWIVNHIDLWEIGAAGNESGIKAWTNSTGRLIITGSGAMTNFANAADVPWNPDVVLEVECGSAITPIGKNVFAALGDAVLVNGVAAGEIRHAFGITADETPAAAVTAEFEKIAIENGKADFVIKVKKAATLEGANWDSATLSAVGIDGSAENGRVKVTVSAGDDKGFYALGFKKVGDN